ncbi:MAG: hypothetical protein HY749_24260 [Gammaproteobacteria bacterium]|nr:hypothetical protein [Gammaproteobacteria bacterium]MBI5617584.1 hypothetical protein [Gammaproteobacteria bacterium]
MQEIGRLLAIDEQLNHQIADTFGTVAESDLAWTEKLWTPSSRKDGGLQIDVGLGRYQNRDVMDAFAGISRGREQWTVRASRELSPDPLTTAVGPIRYEVIEPLKKIRWTLDHNDVIPLRFDVTFEAVHPCFFEDRHIQRDERGFRVVSNVVRYHQAGVPSGWVEIEGRREEIDPADWFSYRDHSWGVRLDVGAPPTDLRPARDFGERRFEGSKFLLNWSPLLLERPDGTRYEYHFYLQIRGEDVFYFSGYRNHADGRQERIARVRSELRYDDATRRLLGGRLWVDMLNGETNALDIEVMGESGFYLATALYLGFEGRKHGNWRGLLHVDGERIADITVPGKRKRLATAVRDTIVRVRDGNASGYGLFEPIVLGAWPELGLTADGHKV